MSGTVPSAADSALFPDTSALAERRRPNRAARKTRDGEGGAMSQTSLRLNRERRPKKKRDQELKR